MLEKNKNLFVLLIVLLMPFCVLAEVQNVFILDGQSNNAGLGTVGTWPENPNVQIYNKDTKQFENLKEGFGFGSGWGLEMSLGEMLSGVYIIKAPWAGGSLYDDFYPRSGAYYIQFMDIIYEALSKLSNPEIIAYLWTQGEADSRYLYKTAAYEQNQRMFIRCVRQDLDMPCLPFIMNQIAAIPPTYQYRKRINQIKRRIAGDTKNVATFSTLDLPLKDTAHYNDSGLYKLGRRYAKRVIKFLCL